MEVIITRDQLEAAGACDVYLRSPEWDAEHNEGTGALVYSDWEATVARLSSTQAGLGRLGYLVGKRLVPMSRIEFRTLRREKQAAIAVPEEQING